MGMKGPIITLNEVKRSNLRAVLALLVRSGELSRVEIAERLGCDNTTVSRAVRELIGRGVIGTAGRNGGSPGRPRVALRVDPEGPQVIGIALEPECVTGVLTDLASSVRHSEKVIFRDVSSQEAYLLAAEEIVSKLVSRAGERLAGVGATVFGSYYGEDFTVEKAAALPLLNGVKLRPFFERAAGREVLICDHTVSRARLLARRYPELNAGSVLLAAVGRGLGLAAAENGRLLFSRNGHGGEFGHMVRVPGGIPCACGRRGCLETVSSTAAMTENYRRRTGRSVSFDALAEEFRRGSAEADAAVLPALDELGRAFSEQLNNWQADKLAVTGDVLKLGPRFEEYLTRKIEAGIFSLVRGNLSFHFPDLRDEDSLAVGAAVSASDACVANFE